MKILELGQSPWIVQPVEANMLVFHNRTDPTVAGHTDSIFSKLQPQTENLLEEYTLDVRAGSLHILHINCTPDKLPALILGRLLTDGIIAGIEDIVKLEVHLDTGTAEIVFTEERIPRTRCNEVNFSCKGPNWNESWIRTLYARFCRDTDLHRFTRCTHSCFLMQDGKIIAETEDIGRHNAIDKAIGCALLQQIPLSECILFTTGRLPEGMVNKAVRAGIRILVSKEAPTAAGVRVAKAAGITIIGKVREDSLMLYTEADRIY